MDIRERHFGRIAVEDLARDTIEVDVGALIRRLILFEQCTVESVMLKEIPALVSVFGVDGFLKLLDSGTVRIICDAMTAGQVGQAAILRSAERRGGPLPLCSYRIANIGLLTEGGERKQYIHQALQEVHKAPISFKQQKKLKLALVPRLLTYPSAAGNAGVADTQAELVQQHPLIWEAIRIAALGEVGIDIGNQVEYAVSELGVEGDVRVDTSLTTKHGLSDEQAHRVVERGILSVAGMNQRIRLMESFEAVTGFLPEELPLFEKKLSFLLKQTDPDAQERRFDRIVTIAGPPDVNGLPITTTVDVDRLLRIRDDPECKELRHWVRSIDSETDEDIARRFEGVRGRIAAAVEGKAGKAVRFLLTTGASAIPVAGVVAGPAATAADTFLLERLIGKPGPATFLSKYYKSIFKD